MTSRGLDPRSATRVGFVRDLHRALADAGVEHTFLHDIAQEGDADVDVVVGRASLEAVDTLVRSGALGRLVQRLDYDVPWCRFYVVQGDGGVLRKIDVAADPYGIGQYGDSLPIALRDREVRDGLPVPSPPARCLYLATKRARKQMHSPAETLSLRLAYDDDRAGAAAQLRSALGSSGAQLVDALESDSERLEHALCRVADELTQRARSPRKRVRRIGFEAVRVARRYFHPTGLVVSLVGPDGTGKTALAEKLEAAAEGPFRRVARRHLGPGLLPPPGRLLGRVPRDFSRPHSRPPSAAVPSLGRIAYLALDQLAGWPTRMSLPRVRSTLVVVERGWDDLLVDPRRYRLSAGSALVRGLRLLLPRPDLTLLLSGDSTTIVARKPELTAAEVDRQLGVWRSIAAKSSTVVEIADADGPEDLCDRALVVVYDRLAERQNDLARFATAIECLGRPSVAGKRYSIVRGGRRARWILPRQVRAGGPLATRLYRPDTLRHALGAAGLEAAQRLGGIGLASLVLDETVGLGPEIAAALHLDAVELAALLPTDSQRRDRAVLTVLHRRRPTAIAKVARAGSMELERERRLLHALETLPLTHLVPPAPLASFAWRGHDVLLTTIVPGRGRTSRALGRAEEDALVELSHIGGRLLGRLGAGTERWFVHGDFSGWNSMRTRARRLALWDWEWARPGCPLEDYFHWQAQRVIKFGYGTAEEIVRAALEPEKGLLRLCSRIGASAADAAPSLAASIQARIDRLTGGGDEQELAVNEELAALLRGRR